jgi:divalent metal cation (Fe/Co/Zn/Cd) transporter
MPLEAIATALLVSLAVMGVGMAIIFWTASNLFIDTELWSWWDGAAVPATILFLTFVRIFMLRRVGRQWQTTVIFSFAAYLLAGLLVIVCSDPLYWSNESGRFVGILIACWLAEDVLYFMLLLDSIGWSRIRSTRFTERP